jgi:hypothetical protein
MSADPFDALLSPGEVVLAVLSGPGPVDGQNASWFQLAWTPGRLLVVRSVRGPLSTSFAPAQRFAASRMGLRVSRFPRTPGGAARLEVEGAGMPISVVGIDESTIFAQVEPFLAAWGGPVQGAGEIRVVRADPYAADPSTDTRKLLMVMGVCLGMVVLCCGCSGLLLGLQALWGRM